MLKLRVHIGHINTSFISWRRLTDDEAVITTDSPSDASGTVVQQSVTVNDIITRCQAITASSRWVIKITWQQLKHQQTTSSLIPDTMHVATRIFCDFSIFCLMGIHTFLPRNFLLAQSPRHLSHFKWLLVVPSANKDMIWFEYDMISNWVRNYVRKFILGA